MDEPSELLERGAPIAVDEESEGVFTGRQVGRHRRAARPARDRVPEPPRRVPRRRIRICAPAGGVRAQAPRGPRRPLTAPRSHTCAASMLRREGVAMKVQASVVLTFQARTLT